MSVNTVLAFAALAAVLVAIPGPAVVLVLKSAMLRGRDSAIITAPGVFSADLIWATASIIGLTARGLAGRLAVARLNSDCLIARSGATMTFGSASGGRVLVCFGMARRRDEAARGRWTR